MIPAAQRLAARDCGHFDPDLTAALAFVGFPAVVKPASRHSSWGVVAVRDLAELGRALADFHDHEIVLVEELVAGQEYSVESLVQHGSIVFASATTKETQANGRTFVELSHSVPEPRPELCELLLAANAELLARLRFADGIAHSEWRITDDGRAVLMGDSRADARRRADGAVSPGGRDPAGGRDPERRARRRGQLSGAAPVRPPGLSGTRAGSALLRQPSTGPRSKRSGSARAESGPRSSRAPPTTIRRCAPCWSSGIAARR